ncbi:MAG: radical SAM protein [Candidatus Pacearchaeota archaeon]|jgi:radical SAM superfamily enzyme YgiQ (UPF0313 family)
MKNSRVLLIYPPNQLMDIETPRPDGSLGPLYLASSLERNGISTEVLDASVGGKGYSLEDTFYRNIKQENGLTRIGMNFSEIADYVSRNNYNVVGISSNFTPQTNMAINTARAIKESSPNTKIYAGGVNARALNERFLRTGYFDGICLTEGELIFPRLILEGRENTPGIAYIKDNNIITNPVDLSCFPASLDELAMPSWEKLPMDKYSKIASPHGVDVTESHSKKYAPMMTSRGCVFKCLYCHISSEGKESDFGNLGKLRTHSIERVINEMDTLKSLGIERIFFEDDTLLAIKPRVKEIFSIAKDKGFSISNVNGVNLINFFKEYSSNKWEIDIDYLNILKQAGFEQVVFPIESGSQRILDKYASGKVKLDRMDLSLLMRTMSDMNIKAPVNLMIGFPDETEEEVKKSIEMGKRMIDSGAPYVTFFIPIPFPGSRLYDMALLNGNLENNFDPDTFNWKRPVMINTNIPRERIEELRDYANEEVNKKEHLKKRLEDSIGYRWKSNS